MDAPVRRSAGAGLPRWWRRAATVGLIAALAGCAQDDGARRPQPPHPDEVRALIVRLMPATLPDRPGWAADIYAAMSALKVPPQRANLCAVLAVTEQESSFRADPAVPNLPQIAWQEIERRTERIGVPMFAVRAALALNSPTGQSYRERIDAVKTERELSVIFEDFTAMVPLGERLFAGLNPVRTGGPMQVSIAFAEAHAQADGYPYEVRTSVRHEVFTRRGGLYFGIAHLLAYPASYDQHLYRFADFNAGRWASRNAAFQQAVSRLAGIPLALDGDLIRQGARSDDPPGPTEVAVRALGASLGLDNGVIRRALEQGDAYEFERTPLYRRVFELADGRSTGQPAPRAVLPQIDLSGPKINRKLTTAWFANRVNERMQRCMSREVGA
jgi:hypothetical protein